jgi:hypothetical protein
MLQIDARPMPQGVKLSAFDGIPYLFNDLPVYSVALKDPGDMFLSQEEFKFLSDIPVPPGYRPNAMITHIEPSGHIDVVRWPWPPEQQRSIPIESPAATLAETIRIYQEKYREIPTEAILCWITV